MTDGQPSLPRALVSKVDRTLSAIGEAPVAFGIGTLFVVRPLISGRTYTYSNTLFQLAIVAMVGFWLVRAARKKNLEVRLDGALYSLAVFIGLCGLTFLVTVDVNATYRCFFEFVSYLLLFMLAANAVEKKSSVRSILIAALVSSLIVCAYGYAQRLGSLEHTRAQYLLYKDYYDTTMIGSYGDQFMTRLVSNRIFSFFLFPNAFAGYLILLIPVTLGLMIGSQRWPFRLKCAVVLFGLCTCLILTYSRGAFLGLAAALCVLLYLVFRERKTFLSASKAGAAAILLLMVLRVSAVGPPLEAQAPQQADQIEGQTLSVKDLAQTNTLIMRTTYWRGALNAFANKPLLGIGLAGFSRAYPKYMMLGGYPVRFAHNDYLQVLAETGVFGFAAYLSFWVFVIYGGWRCMRSRESRAERWICVGILCAVLAFLTHTLVDFDLYIQGIGLYVFGLSGLMLRFSDAPRKELRFGWPSAAVASLALIVVVFLSFRPFYADRIFGDEKTMGNRISVADHVFTGRNPTAILAGSLFSTEEIEMMNTSDITHEKQIRMTIEKLDDYRKRVEEAIAVYPLEPIYHAHLGLMYQRMAWVNPNPAQLIDKAIRSLRKAVELAPAEVQFRTLLSEVYFDRGNRGDKRFYYGLAIDELKAATEVYPTSPAVWRQLGDKLDAMGYKKEAQKYLEEARRLEPFFKT